MWRSTGVAVVLVAVLALVAVVAGAHGNHVAADAQVVGDGGVVVESYFSTTGGFLVVHADDGGQPGRVLGHVEASQGSHADLTVPVENGALPEAGTTTVWAVLHEDDGDGEFEPGADSPITAFGSVAGTTFQVATGSKPVVVTGGSQSDRRSNGSVTLDRVALSEPGYVVLRANDRNAPGTVVGHAELDAGTHRGVTVELDRSYFADQSTSFEVWAVVHRDDGDGEFEPDADRPVTVGDRPVGTLFSVVKDATDDVVIQTPESTTTGTVTTSVGRTDTTSDASDPGGGDGDPGNGGDDGAGDDGGGNGGDRSQPGFGVGLAAGAVVVALVVRRLR